MMGFNLFLSCRSQSFLEHDCRKPTDFGEVPIERVERGRAEGNPRPTTISGVVVALELTCGHEIVDPAYPGAARHAGGNRKIEDRNALPARAGDIKIEQHIPDRIGQMEIGKIATAEASGAQNVRRNMPAKVRRRTIAARGDPMLKGSPKRGIDWQEVVDVHRPAHATPCAIQLRPRSIAASWRAAI